MNELARLARRRGNGADVSVAFDRETGDGLASFGDAFDDLIGPCGLDSDDDAGGDIGIRACSDQSAEVQLEIFPELETAVGVRQRQSALDVVAHGLARGVGEIVERKNDDVIADAYPAIFPPKAVEIVAAHLPPLRFQVMCVHVAALADMSDGAADVVAIFQNGVAGVDVAERDFVAERHGVKGLQRDGLVGLHDPARQVLPGAHVFDDHHADCIVLVVDNELCSHPTPQKEN